MNVSRNLNDTRQTDHANKLSDSPIQKHLVSDRTTRGDSLNSSFSDRNSKRNESDDTRSGISGVRELIQKNNTGGDNTARKESRSVEVPHESIIRTRGVPHRPRHERRVGRMALQRAIDPTEFEQNIIQSAQNLANRLNREIEAGNDTGAFMLALSLAVFKDFLDIVLTSVGLGLIPGVNFAVGLFLSSFLFFFMLGKGWMRTWRLRIKFWVLGLFIDGLPAFSALPINSLLVLDAWRRVKKHAGEAKVKKRDLFKLTQREINTFNNEI